MSQTNHRVRRSTSLALAALAVAVALPAASQAQSPQPRAYAATADSRLLTFSLANPLFTQSRAITGLAAGDRIVGIDERPLTGVLYAVTKGSAGAGRAYTIDPATGTATLAFALVANATAMPITLTGTQFGVDFNPVADALRIVSDSGQNLRALPSDRPAGLAGVTFTDGALSRQPISANPRAVEQGVNSAAYTNSDRDPMTLTTLYDIDATTQRELVIQAPPNDGTLTTVAPLDLGVRQVQGFDIRGAGEAYVLLGGLRFGSALEAFFTARGIVPSLVPVRLFALNLASGALEPRGLVGTSAPAVGFTIDIPTP